MKGLTYIIVTLILTAQSVVAQRGDITDLARFEVVSIRPAQIPADVLAGMNATGGACPLVYAERSDTRVSVPAATLCALIRLAYDVEQHQVVGVPTELSRLQASTVFQIEARVPERTGMNLDAIRPMLQSMLAERFRLRVHRESREQSVYALVVSGTGRRQTSCSNPNATSGSVPGRIISCAPPIPMARVAQMLSRDAGLPVVDRTGIAPFAFELHWLPMTAQAQPDSPPILFTAIQEQLGLRLEPQRVPLSVIVVDHAEAPSPN